MTPPAAVSEPAPAAPTETVAETQTADNTPPNPAPVVSAPASEGPPISPARAKRERDAWLRELMAWLVKHRVYPEEAKKDKAQGIVHVRFSIDRNGNLLAASIDKGLGYAPLDRAALDVLHRASPMPPLPRAITSDRVTLTLPIEFSLRTE